MKYVLTVAGMLLFCTAFVIQCTSPEPITDEELGHLQDLYESKNYFEMRDRLQANPKSGHPQVLYYRSAVYSAFNKPEESNRSLNRLIEMETSPDSLLTAGLKMKMYNYLRLHEYEEAFDAAKKVLGFPDLPNELMKDVQNTKLIVEALVDIPPQQMVKRGDSEIPIKGSHIDVTINSHPRDYAYDTGANFSILMESEARALDIPIIEADFDVGTATGKKVKGNLGVADTLMIGNMVFNNVVFLVFPDEALTFPGGFQLKGIIGFPVLEAMGELQFRDGTLFVPETVPDRSMQNLALEGLTPLIEFKYEGDRLLSRFDTGANKTVFYEPFYLRYFSKMADSTRIDTVKSGGVGGVMEYPVYPLNRINIEISGTEVQIDNTYAHTKIVGETSGNFLYANIGLDILENFERYIFNFRDMSFIIE